MTKRIAALAGALLAAIGCSALGYELRCRYERCHALAERKHIYRRHNFD